MKTLRIETKDGTETIQGVEDWGWSAETGHVYYRIGKELHRKRCIKAEEIKK